ncbi:MAG: hypothetical protein QME65_04675 [Candidatus Omnitrophota bacterium]|nr:hypothetical protein [Candidatus Omnitrophota bacterium]
MLTITSFSNTTVPAGHLIIQDVESVAGSVNMYKAMVFGHES